MLEQGVDIAGDDLCGGVIHGGQLLDNGRSSVPAIAGLPYEGRRRGEGVGHLGAGVEQDSAAVRQGVGADLGAAAGLDKIEHRKSLQLQTHRPASRLPAITVWPCSDGTSAPGAAENFQMND